MQSTEYSTSSQSIAAAVKELMDRKGVPERQKSKTLAEVLNLSYSQAHRKLNTGVDWTIGQLRIVAEHFDESLASIGLDGAASFDEPAAGEPQPGLFVVVPGEHELPCQIWVGEQLHTTRKVDYVAYEHEGVWRAVAAHTCPDNVARRRIHKLEIVVKQPFMPTIAIVDDEKGFADNMCEFLNESGFQATAFYSAAALERVLQERSYDGYIIDWILGDRTAENLIKRIRHSDSPVAPVFLLTGEVTTGLVDESELARVIMALDVQCREKPIRLPTFSAELLKAVGS